MNLEEEDEVALSSIRKLWVWYDQLPALNRITREIMMLERGDNVWDDKTAVLADVVDAVNYNTYAIIQGQSKQRVKQPKPYPRPDYMRKLREKQDRTPKRNRLPGVVHYVPRDVPKEES